MQMKVVFRLVTFWHGNSNEVRCLFSSLSGRLAAIWREARGFISRKLNNCYLPRFIDPHSIAADCSLLFKSTVLELSAHRHQKHRKFVHRRLSRFASSKPMPPALRTHFFLECKFMVNVGNLRLFIFHRRAYTANNVDFSSVLTLAAHED